MWISMYIIKSTYFNDIEFMQYLFRLTGIIIYCLLGIKVAVDNRFSIKTIFVGLIFIVLLLVSRNSKSIILMETMFFIYSSRNVDFKDILRITLVVQILLMLTIVISSLTGVIKNDTWSRSDGSIRYG